MFQLINTKIWISSLLLTTLFFPCYLIPVSGNSTQFESPLLRSGHAMAYDSVNQQIILFGGITSPYSELSDTWIFDCNTDKWENLNPSVHPSRKSNHKMVFDSSNQKVILFGGWSDETWVFDPSTKEWEQMHPETNPSARHSFSMYYDSSDHNVVLFGGFLNNEDLENDLWKYDYSNNTWTQYTQTNAPAKRYGHTMVYDSLTNEAILFGGRVSSLTHETWKYFNNTWEIITPSNKPATRYWHDMVYDFSSSQIVLFGGDNEQSSERALGDTWVYRDNNWNEKSHDRHPQARNNHDMVYDALNQRIILFGGLGEDYSHTFDDTWMLKDNLWTQINETKNSASSTSLTSSSSSISSNITTDTKSDTINGFSWVPVLMFLIWWPTKIRKMNK